MQLTSMRLSAQEAKEEGGYAQPANPDLPRYPYGLCLDLNDEVLQKLGITSLPTPGTTMQLIATVEVSRISEYQNQEGKDACMGLQITDMALSAPAASNTASSSADIAKALYG